MAVSLCLLSRSVRETDAGPSRLGNWGANDSGGRVGEMRLVSIVKANAVTICCWVGAVCCGALVVTASGRMALIALAGLVFLVWRPMVTLILVLLIAQEVKPGAGFSGLTVFGSDVYYSVVGKIPATVILLGIAALVALATRGTEFKRVDHVPRTFVIAATLLLGAGISGLASGMDIAAAVGQVARPFVIFALAWIVGVAYGSDVRVMRSTAIAGGAGVTILAVTGLPSALTGAAGADHLVFYDTATAALAASFFLAILRSEVLTKVHLGLAACAAVVLVVSFRRSVILSLVITLALMFMLSKQYRRMVRRVLVWGGGFVLIGMFAIPDIMSTFADRILSSYSTLEGTGEEVSTAGHVDDIAVGLRYALEQPLGYGPQSPQLTGFFVQSGTIYVHNELLLDWLRFGVVGLILTTAFLVSLLADSLKVFQRIQSEVPIVVSAASFIMPVFVIASLSAPFLTTTNRWPAVLGLAAGIMAAYCASDRISYSSGSDEMRKSTQVRNLERTIQSGT